MNFEPAVMRKLERWSKEENEEETEDGIRVSFLGDSITTYKDYSGTQGYYYDESMLPVESTWWMRLQGEVDMGEIKEECIYGKTDDFADAYYTMLRRSRNDYPDAEVVCMIPYHTIYSAALPVLLEDTEKEAAIISMMRMAEWCVTAG